MKTTYRAILILAVAVLFALALPCLAAEKGQKGLEKIRSEDKPEQRFRWFELTDEAVERMMGKLAESDPEEAKKLEKLQKTDPEKFRDEMRKVMRERYHERFREHRAGQKARGKSGGRRLQKEHAEYLEWLRKNCPEKAEKLAKLRKGKPKLYERKLQASHKRYGRIAETAKKRPKFAKVLKEDLELKEKRDRLLAKIGATVEVSEKKQLLEELEGVISSRFDLILRRKQIAYEHLRKRLKNLEKRVKQNETELTKWKEIKDEKVKERLEELVGKTERFKWD